MQLRPIEIDLDVYRYIEQHRTSFSQVPNDIIRALFGLSSAGAETDAENGAEAPAASQPIKGDWCWKGVTLPAGSELRMTYNGRTHTGVVSGGAWQIGGATYSSPSAAADALARSRDGNRVSLNGWRLWEALKPGSRKWVLLDNLRPASSRHSRQAT